MQNVRTRAYALHTQHERTHARFYGICINVRSAHFHQSNRTRLWASVVVHRLVRSSTGGWISGPYCVYTLCTHRSAYINACCCCCWLLAAAVACRHAEIGVRFSHAACAAVPDALWRLCINRIKARGFPTESALSAGVRPPVVLLALRFANNAVYILLLILKL